MKTKTFSRLPFAQVVVGRVVSFVPPFESRRVIGQIVQNYGNVEDGYHYVAVRSEHGRIIDMEVGELAVFDGEIGFDWFDLPLPENQQRHCRETHVPWPV